MYGALSLNHSLKSCLVLTNPALRPAPPPRSPLRQMTSPTCSSLSGARAGVNIQRWIDVYVYVEYIDVLEETDFRSNRTSLAGHGFPAIPPSPPSSLLRPPSSFPPPHPHSAPSRQPSRPCPRAKLRRAERCTRTHTVRSADV